MSFWVLKNDKRIGPFTRQQVQQALASGKLAPTDHCQQDGQATWTPISIVLASPAVAATAPADAPPIAQVPPQPGKPLQIYIAKDGQRFGPFSHEQANALMASGQFSPSHLAWHEGLAAWAPLGTLCSASVPLPAPLPMRMPAMLLPASRPTIPSPQAPQNAHPGVVGCLATVIIITILVVIAAIIAPWVSEKNQGNPGATQSGATLITRSQWKEKLRRACPEFVTGQLRALKADDFKALMGPPASTQSIGDITYWYYVCSDGQIQMVIQKVPLDMSNLILATDVNDF
ncbi:MAG: DUF4339 domain-containing protein [Verrucomicrobia bacterium]|nr:DUF4339 domain-containing protein [Verrucomicrobiota bacterium]